MIIHKEFIWLHFPRCAGTKVETLFIKYFSDVPGIKQDHLISPFDPIWHDSISDREKQDPDFKLGDRTVICSFRQLPSWLASRFNYEKQRNPHLPHNPEELLDGFFLEADGYKNHVDYYPKYYLPESLHRSNAVRFIRTEFLKADFKSVFGDFLDISVIPENEYLSIVNSSTSALPAAMEEQLQTQKENLYGKCPYWASIEKMAYDEYHHFS